MAASVRRTRVLLRLAIVVGTVTGAVIVTACSGDSSANGDQGIGLTRIEAVANAPEAAMPLDATPSPDGKDVYFLAFSTRMDEDGQKAEPVPAVFKAVPGAAPVKLHEGAPLTSPFNISISDDGQTLFIADSGAETSEEVSGGVVFTMNVAGGAPAPLAGTEGLQPAGLDVRGDAVFITGKRDGQAGLFRTGLAGGSVVPVAVGGPFVDPGGVAVSRSGDAFVVDTGSAAAEHALASVVRVSPDGRVELVAEGISVGHPAGIALFEDETALLVSALDNEKGTDIVHRIEIGNRSIRSFSDKIGEFQESAGLHRARFAEVFAWADSHANGTGTVYVLGK